MGDYKYGAWRGLICWTVNIELPYSRKELGSLAASYRTTKWSCLNVGFRVSPYQMFDNGMIVSNEYHFNVFVMFVVGPPYYLNAIFRCIDLVIFLWHGSSH